MKLTESRIKEIILEEIQAIVENEKEVKLGQDTVTQSAMGKHHKDRAAKITQQQGIDPKEYGIMKQFEELLQKLADITDIKTGKPISVLNPAFKRLRALLDDFEKNQQNKTQAK
tara:strand:+ start:769 stop:1110 length:342 start_codon:yes stop_codon:yes gene_type:complete